MATKTQSRTRSKKSRAPRRRRSGDEITRDAAMPAEAIVLSPAQPVEAVAPEPRNHRELAQAIFAKCNPVEVGRELLESGSEKGASVRARVFETLANWQFGNTPDEEPERVRIIWDVPRPPRNRPPNGPQNE